MATTRALLTAGCAVIASLSLPAPASADISGFTSPSGNIGCMLDETFVRCDIRQRDWTPPPRPSDCPSFTGYGQGIEIAAGHRPRFVCAGDTAYSLSAALPYGHSMSAGPLTCTSAESGMTCRDDGSGHGFTLSRQGYQLF